MNTSERSHSRGIALLITLMILVVLVLMVYRFAFSTRAHLASASIVRDAFQAEAMAISGVEAALAVLDQDEDLEVDHMGEQWALLKGSASLELKSLPEDAAFSVVVEDESAKLNLNALLGEDGQIDPSMEAQIRRLLEILGLPTDRMDALLDWIDPDDDRRAQGAESSDYQALDTPYPCRNGPLRTLGELELVLGWAEILQAQTEGGKTLAQFLTVAPTDGRLNLNTASSEALQSLDPELDEGMAARIIALREEAPLETPRSLLLVPGMTQELFQRIQSRVKVNGGPFTIRSTGIYRRGRIRIEAQYERSEGEWVPLRWREEG